jgi:hypothetical protein
MHGAASGEPATFVRIAFAAVGRHAHSAQTRKLCTSFGQSVSCSAGSCSSARPASRSVALRATVLFENELDELNELTKSPPCVPLISFFSFISFPQSDADAVFLLSCSPGASGALRTTQSLLRAGSRCYLLGRSS